MGKYGEILEDFCSERTRIVDVLAQDENKHVIMRLIGALAFRTHCPQYGHIQDKLGRKFTDIDFASYPRFVRDIRRILTELGYEADKQVTQLFGDRRRRVGKRTFLQMHNYSLSFVSKPIQPFYGAPCNPSSRTSSRGATASPGVPASTWRRWELSRA